MIDKGLIMNFPYYPFVVSSTLKGQFFKTELKRILDEAEENLARWAKDDLDKFKNRINEIGLNIILIRNFNRDPLRFTRGYFQIC